MVGRAGFEPAYRFREPNLQSGAINHSTTDPQTPLPERLTTVRYHGRRVLARIALKRNPLRSGFA